MALISSMYCSLGTALVVRQFSTCVSGAGARSGSSSSSDGVETVRRLQLGEFAGLEHWWELLLTACCWRHASAQHIRGASGKQIQK
jgi:hypothetical protein